MSLKRKAYSLRIVKEKQDYYQIKVKGQPEAVEYARKLYGDDIGVYESFWAIYLNRANNTIGHAKISQGGISATLVDLRLIFKYAVEMLASGIILIHNHPSGNGEPSNQDIELTKMVKDAAKLFDITLHDHIILTENNWHSMYES